MKQHFCRPDTVSCHETKSLSLSVAVMTPSVIFGFTGNLWNIKS